MSTCCLETKCYQCCKETNMLLTKKDVETITKLGYDPAACTTERNGWLQLKNKQGRCIFHTGERCSIYEHRPQGCTLYPVVYDAKDRCAILDQECPQRHRFQLTQHSVQTLETLVVTLRHERAQRKKI